MLLEESLAIGHIPFITVKQPTQPSMIENQVRGVAFAATTGSQFDTSAIKGRDKREDLEQDSIFIELRVLPKSGT